MRIFTLLLLVTVLFSCKKENVEPTIITNGNATVTGIARADLDLTQLGLEYVPEGTIIMAKINLGDLVLHNDNDSIMYGDRIYKTTVGSNGRYTINVEANTMNVDVSIIGEDFEYNQIVNDSLIVRKIYTLATSHTNVIDGITKLVDLSYNN